MDRCFDHAVDVEADNLWEAIETALTLPSRNAHLRLAVVLGHCLPGFSSRFKNSMEALLLRPGVTVSPDAARAWLALGAHAMYTDRHLAKHAHEQAVHVASESGDLAATAESLIRLCQFELLIGDGAETALALSEQAVTSAERCGTQRLLRLANLIRGSALQESGDLEHARTAFRSALVLAQLGNKASDVAESLAVLVETWGILLEDWSAVDGYLQTAEKITQDQDMQWVACLIQLVRAIVDTHEGRRVEACTRLQWSLANLAEQADLGLASYAFSRWPTSPSATVTLLRRQSSSELETPRRPGLGLNVERIALAQRVWQARRPRPRRWSTNDSSRPTKAGLSYRRTAQLRWLSPINHR